MNIKKHIPNTITCLNALCGSFGCAFAFSGRLKACALCIALAAVADFCDGFCARLLGVSSALGKELDSLSDCLSFGLAPAACVYYSFSLHNGGSWLPFAAFFIAVFSVLRLARFNLDERQHSSFIGLATPANALFWIPFCAFGPAFVPNGIWLAGIAVSCFLLVSPLPMFSLKFKDFRWKGNAVRYLFLGGSAVLLILFRGIGLSCSIVWYILLSVINALTSSAPESHC